MSITPSLDDEVALLGPEIESGGESLSLERCLEIHRLMVRARVLESRMIKMSKSGQGYFWIGGPGEEAFNVALGLQVKKGEGPTFDFLHLHYRNSGLMLALGMPPIEAIRMMAMTATDTHSRGRNFPSHFSKKAWNVIPVTSVIEVQYAMAPGTALMNKRRSPDAITMVLGGDAGTAEGDFASCMIWSTRPENELPVLMIVTNNGWGISTSADSQHSEKRIIDRGKAFGIPGEVVDGNDPIASWHAVSRAMAHCRTTRRPFMLEALVSRLHGHSSSSGAQLVKGESDTIDLFEARLLESGQVDAAALEQVHEDAQAEIDLAVEQALQEPQPKAEDIEWNTYAPSTVDAVYPDDYTGLPH
jgi:2-oxoisovalerate dehydrogenase E1 component alpha subunit